MNYNNYIKPYEMKGCIESAALSTFTYPVCWYYYIKAGRIHWTQVPNPMNLGFKKTKIKFVIRTWIQFWNGELISIAYMHLLLLIYSIGVILNYHSLRYVVGALNLDYGISYSFFIVSFIRTFRHLPSSSLASLIGYFAFVKPTFIEYLLIH